jgi:hypothetical protein
LKPHNDLPNRKPQLRRGRRNNSLQLKKITIKASPRRKQRLKPRERRKRRKPKTLRSRPPRRPHKPKCSLLPTVLPLTLT